MSKANVIIRMGAPYFDARVRVGGEFVHFNLRKMDKHSQDQFRIQLTRAFRSAGLVKQEAA